MFNSKIFILIAVAILLSFTIFSIDVHAERKSAPVRVMNTFDNPVPIT